MSEFKPPDIFQETSNWIQALRAESLIFLFLTQLPIIKTYIIEQELQSLPMGSVQSAHEPEKSGFSLEPSHRASVSQS